jgi:hypothetical protein
MRRIGAWTVAGGMSEERCDLTGEAWDEFVALSRMQELGEEGHWDQGEYDEWQDADKEVFFMVRRRSLKRQRLES